MKDIDKSLKIDCKYVSELLENFIKEEVHDAGKEKVVLAVSGGLDSATSAYLATRALGNENVHAFWLPYKTSSEASLRDARKVTAELGLPSLSIDITDMVNAYFAKFPEMDRLRKANKMARERMSILFDQSAYLDALVLGTSNRTELLLGYGTIYGDMACALNPLGELYKTQVRQLAKYLGVPQTILEKKPTAGLWPGQTDEAELGFTYAKVDRLLYLMIDKSYTFSELLREGFSETFIEKVYNLMQGSRFKRRLPKIAKIMGRTVRKDLKYPEDWEE